MAHTPFFGRSESIIAAISRDVLLQARDTIEPMCGRYSLADLDDLFSSRFKVANVNHLPARYNVSPSQTMPVVLREGDSN
jgi:hypothetical protein